MLNALIGRVVDLLPKRLQPFAKAILPALLVLGSVGVQAVIDGDYDPTALDAAIRGVVMAVLTFAVPNREPAGA